MNRDLMRLLVNRTKLALGSLSLVEKQLLDICTSLDNQLENVYAEDIRGEEEKFDEQLDFFIRPPLEVYTNDN